MSGAGALLCVLLPAIAAAIGLPMGRARPWAREWAILGAAGALAGALLELYGVSHEGPARDIALLGNADLGSLTINLTLRSDSLSAIVAVFVGIVALCVQIYSNSYLAGDGTAGHPTRYPAFAATVSIFTAAMMLVVHADDLILLLIGWEVMGLASYLLVGHHSERPAARAAAVKSFLVTRVGDLGVVVAIVVLITTAGTTSISALIEAALRPDLAPPQFADVPYTAISLLILLGVLGKSAQFPLHTWLPDAMEGPTPASALIHAATMVAAGVFLVARLLPVFLRAPGVLDLAAVIAAITMLGAALAALAQEDLKRLLAYSTISQVAIMLAGVCLATTPNGAAAGIFHLLSHAGFKALLFLVAGVVALSAGTTKLSELGDRERYPGLIADWPWVGVAFALGLGALVGIPPLAGYWSKEAVVTVAEQAAVQDDRWTGWVVLVSLLLTAIVTGMYAGRAWVLVGSAGTGAGVRFPWRARGSSEAPEVTGADDAESIAVTDGSPASPQRVPQPAPQPAPQLTLQELAAGGPAPAAEAVATEPTEQDDADQHEELPDRLPLGLAVPLVALSVATVGFGLILIARPLVLKAVEVAPSTALTTTLLGLAGLLWTLSAPRVGARDAVVMLPERVRLALLHAYYLDGVQQRFVVRPVRACARWVAGIDGSIIDAPVRLVVGATTWAGQLARRSETGLATGYVGWVVVGACVLGVTGIGVAGVVL